MGNKTNEEYNNGYRDDVQSTGDVRVHSVCTGE